jgi:hypothetical protein
MNIWTTFCPQKTSWELTYAETKGAGPKSDWISNLDLIEESLRKLKNAGIHGIRLVVYPSEITKDGKSFNWKPIDIMLEKCKKHKIQVDLCIGPFQYPHYPGIYLPEKMLSYVFDNKRCLDTEPKLWKYGMDFLKEQIARYGNDKRIHGFHLANEWPDPQKIKDREKIKSCVSMAFMLEAVRYVKENTTKPILLNTNIDVSEKRKLRMTFAELLSLLGEQGKLGFDVYPSQFTWKKYPLRKLLFLFYPYSRYFKSAKKRFAKCEFYFCEVEAQPWGGGQSWYQLLLQEKEPEKKVMQYSRDSLKKTWNTYIRGTYCKNVSLWGAEFWLVADRMGITWPLDQIRDKFV